MIDSTDAIIELALREDIGHQDVTTRILIDNKKIGASHIRAKEAFLLAGIDVFSRVFYKLHERITIDSFFDNGEEIKDGDIIAKLTGPLWALLSGERTALNFLQRLAGIATYTRQVVQRIEKYPVRILDTRKTTPGWRILEKEAVRIGGGYNHRWGLYDGILIKDNHIRAAGGITNSIEKARLNAPFLSKIEVETTTLEEVEEALKAKADVIMLDNMSLGNIKLAVDLIGGDVPVEVSGGVTIRTVEAIAETGIDFISMGELTTASRAVDVTMELEN